MTTFVWTITQLDRKTVDGFVTTAHWTCSGVDASLDGDFSGSVYATCSWQETEETKLIPYESLTQEQVLGWIWGSGVDKEATEAAVAAQIEAQKNPVSATGLPWSN